MIPPTATIPAPPRRLSQIVFDRSLDFWMIVLLVSPIYGSFFPAESYVSLPSNEGLTGYQSLPFPITTVEVLLMGVASVGYFIAALRRGAFRHQPIAYCIVAIAMVSAAWAGDPQLTMLRGLRLIPIVLLAVTIPQLYGLKRCLYLMTVAFLISAIMSIFMSLAFPALGVGRIGGAYDYAWRGAMVQKNLTGVVYAVGVYVALLGWMFRGVRPPLAAITVLLCLVLVIKSQSGTAAGALAAGFIATGLLMFVQRCPPRLRMLIVVGALIGLIGGALVAAMLADMLFSAAGRDMTFTGRTPIWAATWDLIAIHPFRGYGYAFWTSESPARQSLWTKIGIETGHSHNSWLDLWLQLGLAGFVAMAFIMWRSLSRSMRLSVLYAEPTGPMFFGMMMLLLIRSMTEVQFTDPFPSIIFFPVWSLTCTEMLLAGRARQAAETQTASTPDMAGRRPPHAMALSDA